MLTKDRKPEIPVHRLKDRHTQGIFLANVDGSKLERESIMTAHRDDHYIFIFQQHGCSNFMVDFEEFTFKGTGVHCILPGQVHAYKSFEPGMGWFLAIETLKVDEQYRRIFEEQLLKLQPVLLAAADAANLDSCARLLQGALAGASDHYSMVAGNFASAYIGLIAAAYQNEEKSTITSNNRTGVIARNFRVLLRAHFLTLKSPAQYAALQNVSVAYLNECVKKETGMPVSFWIQQEIVLEAKRLLYYSELSVKEIAFTLGFEDHAYFSRLFSRAASMAPGQFRRSYHD